MPGSERLMKILIALLLTFSFYANAAITFAWRGGSTSARYCPAGCTGISYGAGLSLSNPALTGQISATVLGTSSGSLSGFKWPGRTNLPSTKVFSVLVRIAYNSATTSQNIIMFDGGGGGASNAVNSNVIQITASAGHYLWSNFFAGSTATSYYGFGTQATESAPDITTFHDFVFTWDGSTTAGKMILYEDAVSLGTRTASSAAATYNQNLFDAIVIGAGNSQGYAGAKTYYDEIVVWDTVIDPTSVTTDTGAGDALDGSARTGYVTVSALDGSTNTGAGAANILSTSSEVIAGVTTNGTYVAPSNANVRQGIPFGVADTGAYAATAKAKKIFIRGSK